MRRYVKWKRVAEATLKWVVSIKACPSRECHPDSQNIHFDVAKIQNISESSKYFGNFFASCI
jgi:hypothetical protein